MCGDTTPPTRRHDQPHLGRPPPHRMRTRITLLREERLHGVAAAFGSPVVPLADAGRSPAG